MSAPSDEPAAVMLVAPARKRGRPPGPTTNYTTQDMQGRVHKRNLPPFRVQPEANNSRAADQQETPCDHHTDISTASASRPEPSGSPLPVDDGCAYPLGLASPDVAGQASPSSVKGQELDDLDSYARQLSIYLGRCFLPVHLAESSHKQAVFCVPGWDSARCQLSLKSCYLPGFRLTSFADSEQLTWWCDCHHTLESARSMFANTDYSEHPSDWLEGRAEKCMHIKALEVHAATTLVLRTAHTTPG